MSSAREEALDRMLIAYIKKTLVGYAVRWKRKLHAQRAWESRDISTAKVDEVGGRLEDQFLSCLPVTEFLLDTTVSERWGRLSERQRLILTRLFVEDQSIKSLAMELQVSPQAIYKGKDRAIAILAGGAKGG